MALAYETKWNEITYPSEKALCKDLGLNYSTFKARKYKGWTLEERITGVRQTIEEPIEEIDEIVEEQSDTKSDIITYNNDIIHSVNELISIIKSFPDIEKINLIDYENVCDNRLLTKNHLKDENIINIFFFNACIYSNNYYSLIKDSNSINLQVISLEAADQLIDHLLIFYLGALVSEFPNKIYRIYSKDSGYTAFVANLNYDNIKIATLARTVKRGYKYSLAKYILNHPEITESKYFCKCDFKNLFKDFYQNKKFNSHTITNLINELLRFEFITTIQLDNKYYRFRLKDISSYVDFIDYHENE